MRDARTGGGRHPREHHVAALRKADEIQRAVNQYAKAPKQNAKKLRELGLSAEQVRQVHRSKVGTARQQKVKASERSLLAPVRGTLEAVGLEGAAHPLRRLHTDQSLHFKRPLTTTEFERYQKTGRAPIAAVRPLGTGDSRMEIPWGPVGRGLSRVFSASREARQVTRAAKQAEKVARGPRRVQRMPEDMSPEVQESAKRVTAALSFGGAKKLRETQDELYHIERKLRAEKAHTAMHGTAGEGGYRAALEELKGELPKLQFDAMKKALGEKDVDELFTHISNHGSLRPYEKVSTHRALARALEGRVPTNYERKLLYKTFGPEFVKATEEAQSSLARLKKLGLDIANIPRSLMASIDVSAPFRQGLVAGARHPGLFAKNFGPMLKQFGSERVHQETMALIHEHPDYGDALEHGLSLTELGPLHMREEQFMSNLAEEIPGIGHGVRASGRAYVGFLDKMRMDMYAHHKQAAEKFYGAELTPEQKQGLTTFINSATGRGSLGRFKNAAVHLNTLFFSPRLLASRVNLLNPHYYAKLDPYSRRQAARSMAGLVGFVGSVLYLAKLAGAKVETDPRNANWAKIRVGNTRIDLLGGFQQPVRLAAQTATGKVISSTTGDPLTLGPGFGQMNRQDIVKRFFEGKLAPVPSMINEVALKGTDFQGNPVTWQNEMYSHTVPLSIQDARDLYKDRGNLPLALGGYALAATGIGAQTYGPRDKTKKVKESQSELRDAFEKGVRQFYHQGLTPQINKALRLRERREVYLRENLSDDATPFDRYNAQIDLMVKMGMIKRAQAKRAKSWARGQDKHVVSSRTSELGQRYFGGDVLSSAAKKIREKGGHLWLSDY